MASDDIIIEFDDVHKSFDENEVLRGLTFDVPKGKVTTILGPSGSGKSVLLKHIIGVLKADSGTVQVLGEDVAQLNRAGVQALRKRIGVLFQSAALFDSMSVLENVAFGLRMHTKMPDEQIRAKVTECLKRVNLVGVEDRAPSDLSGGMRKRAALARAIAMDPAIILYDEPTTGLDPKTANVVGDLILDIHKQMGITAVVVTHDMPLALRISDKIALIYQGVIASQGTPKEIETSEEDIIRRFLRGEL
ncbi:MAG: ABC transporter ATP-binding protein [Candidatus Latescibacteria bacterium]|nr:ABC transporter ATP-binding protein [Candidatus Latescibacterota bacterium]